MDRMNDGRDGRVIVANVEVTAVAARWACVGCRARLVARFGGSHALRYGRVCCGCGCSYEVLSDTVVLVSQDSGTLVR